MFKKITVAMNERVIVFVAGKFQQVLSAGEHTIWHGFKSIELHHEFMQDLQVQWSGINDLLRFDRSGAEKYWQVIE